MEGEREKREPAAFKAAQRLAERCAPSGVTRTPIQIDAYDVAVGLLAAEKDANRLRTALVDAQVCLTNYMDLQYANKIFGAIDRISAVLEPTDHCEQCGCAIFEGDEAFSYDDGPTFCKEHAPTWSDLKAEQDELIKDGAWVDLFEEPEEAEGARAAVLKRLADGDGDKSAATIIPMRRPIRRPAPVPPAGEGVREALEAARRIVALADRFAKCRAEFPIEKDWDFDACSEHEEPFVSACIEQGECIARALLSASPEKGERERALEEAAKVCDARSKHHQRTKFGEPGHRGTWALWAVEADACANAIRALAAPGEG